VLSTSNIFYFLGEKGGKGISIGGRRPDFPSFVDGREKNKKERIRNIYFQ
jgi:hypothetical protein